MDISVFAKVAPWTYWLALPLTIMSVLAVLAVILGYLRKAVAVKYPKQ